MHGEEEVRVISMRKIVTVGIVALMGAMALTNANRAAMRFFKVGVEIR